MMDRGWAHSEQDVQDNRAVSIAITHGLTIAITAILLSLLLIGAGNLLSSQEERVAQDQFDEIGADVVSQVNTLDSLNETGNGVHVESQPEYPRLVAGSSWQMEFTDEDGILVPDAEYDYALNISTNAFDRTLQYPVQNETALDMDTTVSASTMELCLEDDEITLGGCS